MRRFLDNLYLAGGYAAAICLCAIVALIAMKWGARVFGVTFSVGADYAGYAMATASFLSFAYALNHSAHIRVTLGLTALGRHRYWGEVWCFAFATVVSWWIAWEATSFTYKTFLRGYKSAGADATPLWIPQTPMAIGSILLAICFLDNLISLLRRRKSNLVENAVEDDTTITGEI